MNSSSDNGAPWSSPSNISVNAGVSTSEGNRQSGSNSHCSCNDTVIIGSPYANAFRQTLDGYTGSPQFPENVRLPSSVRSLPLNYASPIPASIDTVAWPPDSSSNSVNHDGGPRGPFRAAESLFIPWVGSTSGARAWNAADETEAGVPTQEELRMATRPRRYLLGICCALYLVAAILLIVAQTGSTSVGRPSTDIYLFRLNLTVLFDNSKPGTNTSDIALSQAITESMGLRNYYQTGLWGYCEADSVSAFAACSRPQAFYWFNPVGILFSELLSNSTVTLPVRVTTVLAIVRVVSQVMFGTYLVGMIFAGVLVLVSPLVLLSRWWSLPIGLLAVMTALSLFVGSALATALALAYRLAGSAINQLNIIVTVGDAMFVLVWTATALTFVALVLHAILGLCGPSVRDIRTDRRAYVRLPSLDTKTASAEMTKTKTPSIQGRLQGRGSAITAALKKKSPWFSPLAMHTLVSRDQVVPISPPAGQRQLTTYTNGPPVWGVVT